MSEKLHQLKQNFLEYWTLEKLQNMTLEEYTDTERENSFCYWLEHITRGLGSIVGGSSYKFGIYKMGATSKTEPATNRDNNGVYAWHTKYGLNAIDAFNSIKKLIIDIVNVSKNNTLHLIDPIDLGDAYKWKIAFLYSDYKVVNIFKESLLKKIAIHLNIKVDSKVSISELNKKLLNKKTSEQNYYTFTSELWQIANMEEEETSNKIKINMSKKSLSKIDLQIENLIKEFNVFIESYAPTTKTTYSKNFEVYLKNYCNNNNIYFLEYANFLFLSKTSFKEYQDNTKFDGKGFRNFINFFIGKTKNKPSDIYTLNQILYGPPGTGKTYATKKLSVELIDKVKYENTKEDRNLILERYNELEKKGQIVFTTFHQSISYEDFVEGIKPKTQDKQITYEVEDGIFKKLANKAKGLKGEINTKTNTVDFKNKNYFKISVGGKNRKDVHKWCIENNYVAIGYGGKNDLSNLVTLGEKEFKDTFKSEFSEEFERSSYSLTAASAFIDWLKIGDIVLISLGNHIIDAIGIVTGNYEYHEFDEIPYHHFRKVEWLATNLDADPNLFVDKNISQQTIYQFNNDDIKIDYLEQTFTNKEEVLAPKDHVLIIDEINRGNVSAIFGELITLLEPDKRLGQKEEITVTLPYSKSESKFGIPSNLHIIGTMNTADRSVEALDNALRRRFEFKEMMPDYTVIKNEEVEGIKLSKVLETINNRIELLIDRDHTIGHSYFVGVDSAKKLANAFNNKIVPLLQEYFYGDYGKIGLVLGNGFVEIKKSNNVNFAVFKYDNSEDFKNDGYQLKQVNTGNIIDAVSVLLGTKETPQ